MEIYKRDYSNERFTCPCCGFVTLVNSSGGHDRCPVCYWEDDLYQLNNPEASDGANEISLKEAQRNFIEIGAAIGNGKAELYKRGAKRSWHRFL
jgi:hypothetical protein